MPILLLSAYGGKQLNDEVKKRDFQGFISKNDAATTLLGAVDADTMRKVNEALMISLGLIEF